MTTFDLFQILEFWLLSFWGIPVLMALSNKRCIGAMINENEDSAKRGVGTACANIFAVESGAKIIRVHDVKSAIDSLNVMNFLKQYGKIIYNFRVKNHCF